MSNPVVFMDIRIGNNQAGRIECELFIDKVPKTVQNFMKICTGECGRGRVTKVPMHYKGCPFHRIIAGFMAQGGDFSRRNGTGGESIYGAKFEDERGGLLLKHDAPGLLSMANSGPNTNGSQFFILFDEAPHLDGKHVVFGKVVNGMGVVKEMEGVHTDTNDRPSRPVQISNCGVLQQSVAVPLTPEEQEERNPKPAAAAAEPEEEKTMSYALMVKLLKKGVLQPEELIEGTDWTVARDGGEAYYWNQVTNETSWELPKCAKKAMPNAQPSTAQQAAIDEGGARAAAAAAAAAAADGEGGIGVAAPKTLEELKQHATSLNALKAPAGYVPGVGRGGTYMGKEVLPTSSSSRPPMGRGAGRGTGPMGGKKRKNEDDDLDPCDPSFYSDAPRGKWAQGLDIGVGKMAADSTASGPLFQSRPLPSPGAVIRAQGGGKKPADDEEIRKLVGQGASKGKMIMGKAKKF